MPDLTVKAQIAYGRERLAAGDAGRAVQVCRRILESWPRCVQAYILLGEALLALGQPARSAEMLRRAWGACPDDPAVARGLAQATLVSRGDMPTLTRVGLAELWLRLGLCNRAAAELRALLAEDRGRYDAKALLCQALWRTGAEREAAALAREILASHPFCMTALLIAGAAWLHTDDDAQARNWLQAAQMLDPENGAAQRLLGERAPLPPRSVRLPFREEDAPPLELPYADDEDDLYAKDPLIPL